jgi:hypothetical protein
MMRAFLRLGIMAGVVVTAACPEPAPQPAPSLPPPAPASPTPPVSTPETQAMALRGEFPPGPEVNVFMGKCAICHATSYMTQQRLTPAQWEKTIKKMMGWGAPVTDDEVTALTTYFSTHFPVDLPAPVLAVVAAPPGAINEGTP